MVISMSMCDIMGQKKDNEAECSLHDSNIENRNRILLKRTSQMVQDCHDFVFLFVMMIILLLFR